MTILSKVCALFQNQMRLVTWIQFKNSTWSLLFSFYEMSSRVQHHYKSIIFSGEENASQTKTPLTTIVSKWSNGQYVQVHIINARQFSLTHVNVALLLTVIDRSILSNQNRRTLLFSLSCPRQFYVINQIQNLLLLLNMDLLLLLFC